MVVFMYVDDAFWPGTTYQFESGENQAEVIGRVFRYVVSELLGWELDPGKAGLGDSLLLLGLQVCVARGMSTWCVGESKRTQWTRELRQVLINDSLTPGEASKWAGRFAFMNAYVFNRMGRALLRPVIWRQRMHSGSSQLTYRLRNSLVWFLSVLESGIQRQVSLTRPISSTTVLLYSDAEGNGSVGGVLVFPDDTVTFIRGRIPTYVQRLLKRRRTNITAYELLAALASIVALYSDALSGCRLVHFIDNTAALACVIRGFSKQRDLSLISGRFWYELTSLPVLYVAHYVNSKANLADGPSRNDLKLLRCMNAQELTQWSFPSFANGLDSWMANTECFSRVVS